MKNRRTAPAPRYLPCPVRRVRNNENIENLNAFRCFGENATSWSAPTTEKDLFASEVTLQPIHGSHVAGAAKQRKNI
jgi:hypothetical protein